ncbi:MAG: flagellar basal body rod protein FlgB [Rhodospirillales bacterium]|nr:flagellar basal body rod protein FlgB [Rhodospirillales bacterium]
MEAGNSTLFTAIKSRLGWLGKRQEVIAQNIANSDTPNYKSRDLKPYKFSDMVRTSGKTLQLDANGPGHLGGRRVREADFKPKDDRLPFETSPNGNSVILEEQMAKLNETGLAHRLTNQLYKKHLTMIRMAIGK